MDLLLTKMERDLYKLSVEYCSKKGYSIDDKTIHRIVEDEMDEVDFDFTKKNKCIDYIDKIGEDECCCARIWNKKYARRCSHKRTEGRYCGKHNQMIKYTGKLRFGDIDEPKPEYNEKGEKLFWYDEIDDPCKHLDVVLKLHMKKTIVGIKLNEKL